MFQTTKQVLYWSSKSFVTLNPPLGSDATSWKKVTRVPPGGKKSDLGKPSQTLRLPSGSQNMALGNSWRIASCIHISKYINIVIIYQYLLECIPGMYDYVIANYEPQQCYYISISIHVYIYIYITTCHIILHYIILYYTIIYNTILHYIIS